jgi:hypothetical protein
MGSIVAEDQWSTSATVEVTRRRLLAAFTAAGARSSGGSEPELDLAVGNEGRVRLRGEMFTVVEDFPVHIRIALEPIDGGTQVLVTQSDTFDDDVRSDLHAKYDLAMQHWASHARAALGAPGQQHRSG